jgi:hypothetical protein
VCAAILAAHPHDQPWETSLCEVDQILLRSNRGGLSTGVIVEVTRHTLRGESVGDSCAWLIDGSELIDLTEHQQRKPLLGSGRAQPTAFGPTPLHGRLLVASDGLMKYARRAEILRRAILGTLEESATALLDVVRLDSGAFPDDVALVLAEDVDRTQ